MPHPVPPPVIHEQSHHMLQSFDDVSDPSVGPPRVAAMRELLAAERLDGVIVPRADEFQGEYVPRCAERLAWITGFTGSAGTAVVLKEKAALFVDGRYTVQAAEQTDKATYEVRQVPGERMSAYLKEAAGEGARIGYDPRIHTIAEIEGLERSLAEKRITLVPLDFNPVDRIWRDRPAPPAGQVVPHPAEYAGRESAEKLADLKAELQRCSEDAVVLTNADSIAWLLNIRGDDVPHTPFALSYMVVPREGRAELYIDPAKIGENVRGHIEAAADIAAMSELESRLAVLGAAKAKVRLDADWTPRWFADRLAAAGATVSRGQDPCILPKARKNAAEIAGARAAHLRDAVPVSRFLAWLDREAPAGRLDEIGAAVELERLRVETGLLKDLSFTTISAAGPHAALPHYRVTRASNIAIEPNSVYLVDSGGQYLDGTTDITRTIGVGRPPEEARRRFTLVLKGMIAVSVLRFPKGTKGAEIDGFARRALWQAGLDFDHGTGHGVGSYLSVHEGPQRISRTGTVAFEPGMIVSNEPGYYAQGRYGIRIENLLVVSPPSAIEGGEREMLGFETLTLAPIDRRMIVLELLSAEERAWLDAYHARVFREVGGALGPEDRAWLSAATAPLR
jgi:Xaa-Pro aminopeptidase